MRLPTFFILSLNTHSPFYYADIIAQASNLSVCESMCSFCSRMKRGRIYACARREGYNVIAIGHHLDDIAERYVLTFDLFVLYRNPKSNR